MSSPAGPLVIITQTSLPYTHSTQPLLSSAPLDVSSIASQSIEKLEIVVEPENEAQTLQDSAPRWFSRPRSIHRKRSSSVSTLKLDNESDRKRFGLADIQVYNVSPTDPFEFDPKTPKSMEYRPPASMSGSTPQPPANGSNGTLSSQSASQSITATSSRHRNPPPPSPLSKVSSSSDPAHPSDHTTSEPSMSPPALSAETITSPCYIHSYLDKHGNGSLHDYLQAKSSASPTAHASPQRRGVGPPTGNGTPHTARPHHAHNSKPHVQVSHHSHSTPIPSKSTRASSPITTTNSTSGYDSDRSSANEPDGEYDEEGGNLTKQLAETAQGVREMSKELERTKVRSRIQSVLIVTKARDNALIRLTRELAIYLMQKRTSTSPTSDRPKSSTSSTSIASQTTISSDRGMIVYVDAQLRQSKRFDAEGIKRDHPEFSKALHRRRSSSSASVSNLSTYPSSASLGDSQRRKDRGDDGQLRYWTSEMCSNSPHLFDFVITLGGDGTVLFTSWLFQKIVPPILPFALGSLGFLTNFDFSSYAQTMDRVLDDGIRVNLRMRFTCTVYRAVAPEEANKAAKALGGNRRKAIKRPGGEILMSTVDKAGWEALEGPSNGPMCRQVEGGKDKEIMCFSTRPVEQFEVLNDLVVDRGPSPYVSLLEIFGDEHHLTTVQADGLTVSTPTGSTAYSLSAGGSLVHPQIPAILLTPICPHTLSFRPMLLPDSMELRICVPYNSRSTAWASFDGRGRVELKQGDHIKVTASKYPFPTVCADKASTDWFSSISRTLRWNEREKQKSFVVVEEDHAGPDDGVKGGPERQKKNRKHAEAGNASDPKAAQRALRKHDEEDEDDEEEDENDDEDEEEFDIDDTSGGSGGEGTVSPSSPVTSPTTSNPSSSLYPNSSSNPSNPPLTSPPKSGVSTPSRFATPCAGPPALSQRHLVQKLAAAELKEKDNERGQRDEIRSDSSAFRLPDGGSALPPPNSTSGGAGQEHVHAGVRERHRHRDKDEGHERRPARESSQGRDGGKAKAFAFFGQDDSGSELSDDLQEP